MNRLYKRIRFLWINLTIVSLINSSCVSIYAGASVHGLVPDNSAPNNKVIIDKAANGTPLVQINDPNAAGVSHNKFIEFNVSDKGVVLNNSQVDAVSKLGGVVLANPNLKHEASTIINEVTSTNPSKIGGAIEILGRQADYILANPNGIYVNGVEFINAHKATLTTGSLELDANGALNKLIVSKGEIVFEGKDLNLSNLKYFDVVSRAAKIYAKVHSDSEIKVVTGANNYDPKTRTATVNESSERRNKPSIAIDSSNLGGLYAGKITIISNEKGVGVNLPDIGKGIEDVSITAEGKIIHHNIKTDKDIKIESKEADIVITDESQVITKGGIFYKSNTGVNIGDQANLRSKNSEIHISSGNGKLSNKGAIITKSTSGIKIIGHGLANYGVIYAENGTIKQEATGGIANNGKILSKGKYDITGDSNFANRGNILSDADIVIKLKGGFNNSGSGHLESKSYLNMEVDQIVNEGVFLSANDMNIRSHRQVENQGTMHSSKDLTLESVGDGITNRGDISAVGVVKTTSNLNTNNSNLIIGKQLNLTTKFGLLSNEGSILSEGKLNLEAGNGLYNAENAEIKANEELQIFSKAGIKNKGKIIGFEHTKIEALQQISNEGIIKTDEALFLKSSLGFSNSGEIISEKDSKFKVTGDFVNSHLIKANNLKVRVKDGVFNNSGEVSSKHDMAIKSTEGIDNIEGLLISEKGNLNISAKESINNEGKIQAEYLAKLEAEERIHNAGGITAYDLKLDSKNGALENSGEISSGNSLNIHALGNIDNLAGTILSLGKLNLKTDTGGLKNLDGIIDAQVKAKIKIGGAIKNTGGIFSGDKMFITANNLFKNKGLVETEGALEITGNADFVNSNMIAVHNNLKVDLRGSIVNKDLISTKGALEIKAAEFDNKNQIVVRDKLTLNLTEKFKNSGEVNAAKEISLISNILNNQGNITSNKEVKLEVAREILNQGKILADKELLIKTGRSLTNEENGFILSGSKLSLNVTSDLNNYGHIETLNNSAISASNLSNRGVLISGENNEIKLQGSLDNDNGGHIEALTGRVDVVADSGIDNKGSILSGGKIRAKAGLDIINQGNIKSSEELKIKAENNITNQGYVFSQEDAELKTKLGSIKNLNGQVVTGGNTDFIARNGKVINRLINQNGSEDKYILAFGKLGITASEGIENTKGHFEGNQGVDIKGDNGGLVNSGIIISGTGANLKFVGQVSNEGQIQSQDDLKVQTAASLTNKGKISAGKKATLDITGDIINERLIQSAEELQIYSEEGILNNSAIILSQKDLTLDIARDITNRSNGGDIGAKGKVNIGSKLGKITNQAKIVSLQDSLVITAKEDIENIGGLIQSSGDLEIKSQEGEVINRNNSTIHSTGGEIKLNSEQDITNQDSVIESAADLNIESRSGQLVNSGAESKIVSFESANIKSNLISNRSGLIEAANQLNINTRDFDNDRGRIIGGNNLVATVGAFSNSGQVQGENSLKVEANQGLDNKANGLIISGGTIDIKSTGAITNNGNIQGAAGTSTISSDDKVSNNGAILFSAGDLTVNSPQGFKNSSAATITASDLTILVRNQTIDNDGQIIVGNKISLNNANNFNNDGIVHFREMEVNAGSLIHNKANGELKGINLNAGRTANFNNQGKIKLDGSINVNTDSFTTNTLIANGGGNITITGNFVNNMDLHFGNGNITLSASSITNGGRLKAGSLILKSQTSLDNRGTLFGSSSVRLDSPSGITNSGYIISGGATTLSSAGAINNSQGIWGRDSVSITGSGVSNDGAIKSAGSVAISGSVNNNNQIAGRNSVTITGAVTNRGTIVTAGALSAGSAAGSFNNSGTITVLGNATLTGSSISNSNIIQAGGTLSLTSAGDIINSHSFYGGTINIDSRNIQNKSRIIAASSMSIRASGDVTNSSGAEISLIGNGTLSISANNLQNYRTYEIAPINRGQLDMLKPQLRVHKRKSGFLGSVTVGSVARAQKNWDGFDGRLGSFVPEDIKRGNYDGEPTLQKSVQKVDRFIYKDKLTRIDNNVPIITSNGSITINVNNTDNTAGKISAAGNINISGATLKNQDVALEQHVLNAPTTKYKYQYEENDGGLFGTGLFAGTDTCIATTTKAEAITLTSEPLVVAHSLIQAGGAISGTLAGAVINGSAESGGGKTSPGAASSIPAAAQGNYDQNGATPADTNIATRQPIIPASYNQSALSNPSPSRGNLPESTEPAVGKTAEQLVFNNPTSKAGRTSMEVPALENLARTIARSYDPLTKVEAQNPSEAGDEFERVAGAGVKATPKTVSWDFSDDPEIRAALAGVDWEPPSAPGRYYITETSPIFTEFNKYFSTDNFISRIPGYNPKKEVIHYGDPMKQMDLVRRQMVELTGLMSLEGGDYVAEVKKLYETGERIGQDLKIAPGVTLSKELVDNLQENMVWPEIVNLDGKDVIIPRLYLAKTRPTGQVGGMVANHIDITAGSIYNSSNIIGNTINLNAFNGDIVNKGGKILAHNYLNMGAAGNIINRSGGIIESEASAFMTATNILNLTETNRVGDQQNYRIIAGPRSEIKVGGMLALSTRGDVHNKGSSIKAGSLALNIEGDFVNEAIEVGHGVEHRFQGGHYKERSVLYKEAEVEVAGNAEGIIAGNFALVGSKMKVGGDSVLAVGGDTLIQSAINSHYVDSYSERKQATFLGSEKTKTASTSYKEQLAVAGLEVGKKSLLFNKGSQTFVGAVLSSGEGTELEAEKTSFLAVKTEDFSSYGKSSKNAVWQSAKAVGHDRTKVNETNVAGGLKVSADNIEIERAVAKQRPATKVAGGLAIKANNIELERAVSRQQPAWMDDIKEHGNIRWKELEENNKSWNKKQSGLTKEAAAVVSVAATVGTMWAGGFGAFATSGTTTTLSSTVSQAAVVSLASKTSVSLINNRFDLGKTAKGLTSEESIKSLATDMTLAGITFGITDATGLGRVSGEMGRLQRFQGILERGVVHAGVTSAVTGRSLSKNLEAEAGSALLAMGQSVIGDIAVKHNLAEGGLAKVLMHAGAGALYSSANGDNITAGAIGGAAGELLASTTGSSELTKLAASCLTFATGGSANDISIAGNVSASAVEHNSFMHPKPTWEQEIARQQQLEQAGDIAVDYVKNNPEQALGITTDAASFMSGGPGAVTAKRTAVQAIKTVGSKVAEYFFTTKSQAQKIDQPMTGKIIDYTPANGIKELNSVSIAEQGSTSTQAALPVSQKPALLPNEGKVGTYGELKKLEKPGDNLTPHHIPSAGYMKQFGIKNQDGVSIMVEQPHPGTGGRHRRTETYGKKPNLDSMPREELAKDIIDLRNIYRSDEVYIPEIRESLQEVIKSNKQKFPDIFKKEK